MKLNVKNFSAALLIGLSIAGVAIFSEPKSVFAYDYSPTLGACNPGDKLSADGLTCTTSSDKSVDCIKNPNDPTCSSVGAPSPAAKPGADTYTQPSAADLLGKDGNTMWGYIGTFLMSIFAWLMGVAAITLDTTLYYTVIKMADFVHSLTAIGTTWRILRDLGNIMIIFGFLAIGISIILNSERLGWGKKMLPMLLMSAIFLNFSLFFAQAVIDVGNLFATEIYTQINGGSIPSPATGFSDILTGKAGVSTVIMNQLGLASLFNFTQRAGGSDALRSEIQKDPFFVALLGIILFIVTAFVLFTLAFILLARFVALIFIMLSAPIGFAGLAIPQLEGQAKQWWHQLFQQTISAPILLFLLYIALAVMTDKNFFTALGNTTSGGTAGNWLGLVKNQDVGGFAIILLSFTIAIGLLLAVSYFARSLGAFGASWATKMGGKLSFGFAAAGMRSTTGLASQRLSERFKKSSFARAPGVGRAVGALLDTGAKASYDFRGAGVLKNFPGGGIDAGSPAKGGYREWEKKKIKEREDYAKTLEKTPAEEAQEKDWKKRQAEQEKVHKEELNNMDAEQAAERQPYEEERKKQLEHVQDLRAYAQRTGSQADKDALKAAELTLSNQNKQLDELRASQQQARKKLEGLQKDTLENIKEEIATINRAPQMAYATGLTLGPGSLFNRNVKAAASIEKAAKKSKAEKDSDKLFDLLEKASKKEDGKDKESGGEGKKSDH